MMDKSYEVVGFDRIGVGRLEPHPDAAMPIMDEDKAALIRSIAEGGMILPLLVLDEPEDGVYLVVDGCNRLEAAKQIGGLLQLPCVKIRCTDVRNVALECLAIGRKRSTGQRILAFLERNKDAVLKVADANAGVLSLASRDASHAATTYAEFSKEKISKTLSVSDKDVGLAIDLLRCKERNMTWVTQVGTLTPDGVKLDPNSKKGRELKENLSRTYAGVLAGGTPIRRWKSASAGLTATKNGRPDVDYRDVMKGGMRAVISASKHWDSVPYHFRHVLISLFKNMWAALPTELKNAIKE